MSQGSALRPTKPSDQQHTIVDSGVITQIANALPAGSNLLGSVAIDSGTATVSGSIAIESLPVSTPASAQYVYEANPLVLDLLSQLLVEMRTITYYLQAGLNVEDQPDQIRADNTLTRQ